jgi:asparagine synthase (glutamine-hydrolysing)
VCGIAGVFRFDGSGADAETVEAMLARLERRGPDDHGVAQDGPLTLGHRRLAILDLTSAGHQPMASASGRTVVSFNGEIYNFADLRRELGLAPGDLRSTTDTEILLHAWERWGEGALDRMVGQWAFALYERDRRRLWLVRDRFGEKPLFYHRGSSALAFASSLQALLQAPWVPRRLDRSAMVEFLTLRYVVAPRTVVEGCAKVPPGHGLIVTPEGVELRRWYAPRFRSRGGAHDTRRRASLVEEFGSLLTQAARRCLVSDVPVGLLLSDGIDSHGIRSALAGAQCDVPTFTYTMDSDRGGLALSPTPVSTRAPSWDVLVTPDRRVEALAPAFSSLTEPVGDGASLATWLIIHGAREKAEVFLCGHGGDEILGGYRLSQDRFRLAMLHRVAWLPPWSLRLLVESKVFGGESAAERQRAVWRVDASGVPAAARYLIHRPLAIGDVRTLLEQPKLPEPYLATVDRLYGECGSGASDLDRIQEVMIRTFLSENILSFADSVAMDSSAELRMPFLDRDLVDFVLGLPPEERVSPWPGRTNTKQILRRWARGRVPGDVLVRRKHGFNYGTVRELLDRDGGALRRHLIEAPVLRSVVPGLETWLSQPTEVFRGHREKALWSLLALNHWSEAAGVCG